MSSPDTSPSSSSSSTCRPTPKFKPTKSPSGRPNQLTKLLQIQAVSTKEKPNPVCWRFPSDMPVCGCTIPCRKAMTEVILEDFWILEDKLMLGPEQAAFQHGSLQEKGITHIIDISNRKYEKKEDYFTYLTIPIDDVPRAKILNHFQSTNNFISAALEGGGGVLVHCKAGVSRSATVVIAYLLKRGGYNSVDEALDFVKAKRPRVKPNCGFLEQLKEFFLILEEEEEEEGERERKREEREERERKGKEKEGDE